MKKRVILGMAMVFFSLALAGCGSSDEARILKENINPPAIVLSNNDGAFTLNIWGIIPTDRDYNALINAGYISRVWNSFFSKNIVLGEKAKPFVITRKGVFGNEFTALVAATVKSVEVVNSTKPADFFGQKIRTVFFNVQYELTPVGELITKKPKLFQSGQATFIDTDKGWQIDPTTINVHD